MRSPRAAGRRNEQVGCCRVAAGDACIRANDAFGARTGVRAYQTHFEGDLVYSMECRNIPGLPIGEKPPGYNPAPGIKDVTPPPAPPAPPESK